MTSVSEEAPANLDSLPTEILQQIICQLDRRSLLALGRLNRRLNYMTLAEWSLSSGAKMAGRLSPWIWTSKLEPSDILSVLHKALTGFSKWNIHTIHWRLQTVQDFWKLIDVIEVGCAPQLQNLTIRICAYSSLHQLDPQELFDPVTHLLDKAEARGCQNLVLNGPPSTFKPKRDHHPKNPAARQPLSQPKERSAMQSFCAWMQRRLFGEELGDSSNPPLVEGNRPMIPDNPTRPSCLERIRFDYPPLFEPPFIPYTKALLTRHSKTVKYLELDLFSFRKLGGWEGHCEVLLGQNFPALEDLKITDLDSFAAFAVFGFRNPSIKRISLDTYFNYPKILPITAELPGASFPNLTHLQGDVDALGWLLSSPIALPKLQFLRANLALIGGDKRNRREKMMAGLDNFIVSRPSALPLYLELEFGSQCSVGSLACNWKKKQPRPRFCNVVRPSKGHKTSRSSKGHETSRSNVAGLCLDLGSRSGTTPKNFEAVVAWISRFSSLKILVVTGSIFKDEALNNNLCYRIRRACPQLKLFSYGKSVIQPLLGVRNEEILFPYSYNRDGLSEWKSDSLIDLLDTSNRFHQYLQSLS